MRAAGRAGATWPLLVGVALSRHAAAEAPAPTPGEPTPPDARGASTTGPYGLHPSDWGVTREPAPVKRPDPIEVPYQPRVPGPSGYQLVERRAPRPLLAGLGSFFGGWFFNCIIANYAIATGRDADRLSWLLVPVAGPALSLGAYADRRDPSTRGLETAGMFLSLDLAFQLATTVVLVTGLTVREKVWQRPRGSLAWAPEGHTPPSTPWRWRF